MTGSDPNSAHASPRRSAWQMVVAFGLVSLFADFTYEGARGIVGPYLAVLGAGPILVGLVAGGGELLGYAVRLVSGRLADRNGRHWLILGVGYSMNLLSVPALALAGTVPVASLLVFTERLGKGLRNPVRDALLSRAGNVLGHGRAFGLHEVLDQTGAFVGPLVVAGAVAASGYRLGFAVLLAPALLALLLLIRAHAYQLPAVEITGAKAGSIAVWRQSAFRRYLLITALAVAGFPHFVLIGYHLAVANVLSAHMIPILFAVAMGVDAIAAYGIGHLFDRLGMRCLYAIPVAAVIATVLLFLPLGALAPWIGAMAWGLAMGVQETVMRAGIAKLSPAAERASAYGLFDTVFGLAWMIGSLIFGVLYAHSGIAVAIWSGGCELGAVLLLGFWLLPAIRATAADA